MFAHGLEHCAWMRHSGLASHLSAEAAASCSVPTVFLGACDACAVACAAVTSIASDIGWQLVSILWSGYLSEMRSS